MADDLADVEMCDDNAFRDALARMLKVDETVVKLENVGVSEAPAAAVAPRRAAGGKVRPVRAARQPRPAAAAAAAAANGAARSAGVAPSAPSCCWLRLHGSQEVYEIGRATAWGFDSAGVVHFRSTQDPPSSWIATLDPRPSFAEGRCLHIRSRASGATVNGVAAPDAWTALCEDDVLGLAVNGSDVKFSVDHKGGARELVSKEEEWTDDGEGDARPKEEESAELGGQSCAGLKREAPDECTSAPTAPIMKPEVDDVADEEECEYIDDVDDGESDGDGADLQSLRSDSISDFTVDGDGDRDAEVEQSGDFFVDARLMSTWHWLALTGNYDDAAGARQLADVARAKVAAVWSLCEGADFCVLWQQAKFEDSPVLLGFRTGVFALRALREQGLAELGLRVVSEGLPVGKEVAGSMQKGDAGLTNWHWTALAADREDPDWKPQLAAYQARQTLFAENGIVARKTRTHWRQACVFSDCPILVSFRSKVDAANAIMSGKVSLTDLSQGDLDELKAPQAVKRRRLSVEEDHEEAAAKRRRAPVEVFDCQPQPEPFAIIDQEGVMVCFKPAFWTVTTSGKAARGKDRPGGSPDLQDWLLENYGHKYPFLVDDDRTGCVHRLDIQTSGPILVGTTAQSFHELRQGLRKQLWYKEYLALMHGRLPVSKCCGVMDYKLLTASQNGRGWRTEVDAVRGEPARTLYEAIAAFEDPTAFGRQSRQYTLVRMQLISGRTHQIRVHLQELARELGFEVQGLVGDYKYLQTSQVRADKKVCRRVFLHCHRLHFPKRGDKKQSGIMQVVCPLPYELKQGLSVLEEDKVYSARYAIANREHSLLRPQEELPASRY